jgi:hypothetical protein
LTHVTELEASRHIIAVLIGQDTTPQVLIRVGVAPSTDDVPPATPRRPVDEVLIVRHNSQAKPRRPVDLRWRNEDCGAHPLRDTLSQLWLRELLIEVQDRVEQIVKGAVSSWIRAGLAAAACAASSKPSDSGSSSTSTSTASASQTSCGSSGGTNLSGSADGEMRVYVLAGDPAGGYLALTAALFDSRRRLAKPAGVVAISPLTDICPDRAVCGKARGCLVFPPPAAAVFARYVARAQSRITVDASRDRWRLRSQKTVEIATGDDPCRCR